MHPTLARAVLGRTTLLLVRAGPRGYPRAQAERVSSGKTGGEHAGKGRAHVSFREARKKKTIRAAQEKRRRRRRGRRKKNRPPPPPPQSRRQQSKLRAGHSFRVNSDNLPDPTWPPMTTMEGSMSHRLGRLLSPPATSPSVVAAAWRRLTSVRTDCIPSDAILGGI